LDDGVEPAVDCSYKNAADILEWKENAERTSKIQTAPIDTELIGTYGHVVCRASNES